MAWTAWQPVMTWAAQGSNRMNFACGEGEVGEFVAAMSFTLQPKDAVTKEPHRQRIEQRYRLRLNGREVPVDATPTNK